MEPMSFAKGISWIDDCRIPFVDEVNLEKKLPIQQGGTIYGGGKGFYRTSELNEYNTQGRFPANLLVCDDMLNDGAISKGIKSKRGGAIDSDSGTYSWNEGNTKNVEKYLCGFNDKGTNSRYYDIDKWFNNLLESCG